MAFNQFEVDKAIRAWGSKVTDPYDFGLAALYEKNYAEASKQLASSLDIREKREERNLKTVQDGLVDAATLLGHPFTNRDSIGKLPQHRTADLQ